MKLEDIPSDIPLELYKEICSNPKILEIYSPAINLNEEIIKNSGIHQACQLGRWYHVIIHILVEIAIEGGDWRNFLKLFDIDEKLFSKYCKLEIIKLDNLRDDKIKLNKLGEIKSSKLRKE
jgi:hypothetical protein